jgi:hypothetical protein
MNFADLLRERAKEGFAFDLDLDAAADAFEQMLVALKYTQAFLQTIPANESPRLTEVVKDAITRAEDKEEIR